MAYIQQRFEGFVGSASVERGGDPVFLAHVIGGEETGRAAAAPEGRKGHAPARRADA